MTRLWLLALGGVATLLGCSSSSDADYQFGAADMERVALGTWSGMWGGEKPDGGTSEAGEGDADTSDGGTLDGDTGRVPFTLRIERAVRTGAHPLCDPRVFASRGSGSASLRPLCVSTSEMPVHATLDVSNGSFANAELVGMLRVPGTDLREADLSLKGTSTDVAIIAQWIVGKWLFCVANHANGGPLATCTLDSRAP